MSAKSAMLDMKNAGMKPNGKPVMDSRGRVGSQQGGRPAKSNTPKQIRARARRKQNLAEEEFHKLYKPLDEWDAEELARGRPRSADGHFRGVPPSWINRAVHEQIVRKFEKVVRQEMNTHTVMALEVLHSILTSDEADVKGKPIVPASTKLDAAKFLIEHVIGKPKQRMEADISVRLQAMLGTAMVNPAEQGQTALTQGYIDAEVIEDDDPVSSE